MSTIPQFILSKNSHLNRRLVQVETQLCQIHERIDGIRTKIELMKKKKVVVNYRIKTHLIRL